MQAGMESKMESLELASTIQNISCYMFWKSRRLTYEGGNELFYQALGEEAKEVVGKTDFDFPWAKASAHLYQKADLMVLEGGSILNSKEPRWHCGGPQILLVNKVPLRDKNNAIVGILGVHYALPLQFSDINNLSALSAINDRLNAVDILEGNKKELSDLLKQSSGSTLSNKEIECLSLWLSGYSIKESSFCLELSNKTIEVYRNRIKEKLKVHHKFQLIDLAYSNGTFNLFLCLSQQIVARSKNPIYKKVLF
jgi:DNA-binding CsgD family transcriptional regulator